MFYEVIPGKGCGKAAFLTYSSDSPLTAGQIVLVPVGQKQVPGVVVKKVAQPDFTTKPITKILYSTPLPKHLLDTANFVANYYACPISSTLAMILPNGVEKTRRKPKEANEIPNTEQQPEMPKIQLNNAQKIALEAILRPGKATKLLFGVTGSGKTNIYLKLAQNAFYGHKSTILLVPEIALTGQLVRVFREFFGEAVVLIHSKQTEAERHLIFNSLLTTDRPKIVIGPRSALFAPLSNLGLIIIDEEHESTYYQDSTPRYSAIRVASFMATKLKINLILGSATPMVEDFYIAKKQDSLVILSEKAKKSAIKPEIRLIDFKNRENFTKNRYFSTPLLNAIKRNLGNKQQTLIFHNRRGSSPLTICENCGEEMLCPHCFLPMTLHADTYTLACHTCGYSIKVPQCCPKCGSPGLIHKGFGTKLLETELNSLFPKAKIGRFDADNKKEESLAAIYDEVRDGGVDILIGTQGLAKGLDLPRLATVGVVQADAGINLPDFAAEEKAFQLITQVIGRVGRGHIDIAEVFIQTFQPGHPVLHFAIKEDYLAFCDYLIKKRSQGFFPPFAFLMRLEITMKTEATVLRKVQETVKFLRANPALVVSPPMPGFHERTDKGFTWQIVVRSKNRRTLIEAAKGLDQNFRVTLDPPSLL